MCEQISFFLYCFSFFCLFVFCFCFFEAKRNSFQCTRRQWSQENLWEFLYFEVRVMSRLLFYAHSLNISWWKSLFGGRSKWKNGRRSLGLLCNWVHFDLLSSETHKVCLKFLGSFQTFMFPQVLQKRSCFTMLCTISASTVLLVYPRLAEWVDGRHKLWHIQICSESCLIYLRLDWDQPVTEHDV